jgi:hypothetical protein
MDYPLMRLGCRLFHSDKLDKSRKREGSRGFEFRVPNVFQCVEHPAHITSGQI